MPRQFNPNSKYGRKKMREQAEYNYRTGTPEYRKDIDEIGCVVWGVIIGVCALIFILIALTKGTDSAINWLK